MTYPSLIEEFKCKITEWEKEFPDLIKDIESIKKQKNLSYSLQNPIVFNRKLEEIDTDRVRCIILADNPGKDEQLSENCYYLMGQSGKIARNFFKTHSLVEDFDREVVVLNKTPVHTYSTSDLRKLQSRELVEKSQKYMAGFVHALQSLLRCELWIVGYTELRKGGVFTPFLKAFRELYEGDNLRDNVLVFRHFSFGNFSKDFNAEKENDETVEKILKKIGSKKYRSDILGW